MGCFFLHPTGHGRQIQFPGANSPLSPEIMKSKKFYVVKADGEMRATETCA